MKDTGRTMMAAVLAMQLAVVSAQAQGVEAGPAPAPEHETAVITLDAAVRIALADHPRQHAEREGVRAAIEAVGEARAPYYPEVTASAGYSRWERHAFLPDALAPPDLDLSIGPTNDWFAGLTGRYTVFDGGSRVARLRAAVARRGVTEAVAAQARQDLALEVHQAYYTLLAAGDAHGAAQQDVARAEDHVRLAEERRAAGAVPGGDVARAEVAAAEARLQLVAAEHRVRVATGRLNTAMGRSPDTPVQIATPLDPIEPLSSTPIGDAIQRALRDRPAIAAAGRRVEAAHATLALAESAFRPRLAGQWYYGWRDQDWWPRDRDWSLGVTVQWPLFDGFARTRARARNRADLAREEALAGEQGLRVREDVWRAGSALTEAVEEVRAADALVAQARESARTARERYRAGAGTITDMLDAEAALIRAGAMHVQAAWSYRSARATYRWAQGELPVG